MIRRLAALAFLLSIFSSVGHAGDHLGILGSEPKWNVIERYQETITHDEFASLIHDAYCTQGLANDLIRIDLDSARILTNRTTQTFVTLRFAADKDSRKRVPRLWRPA